MQQPIISMYFAEIFVVIGVVNSGGNEVGQYLGWIHAKLMVPTVTKTDFSCCVFYTKAVCHFYLMSE